MRQTSSEPTSLPASQPASQPDRETDRQTVRQADRCTDREDQLICDKSTEATPVKLLKLESHEIDYVTNKNCQSIFQRPRNVIFQPLPGLCQVHNTGGI